MPKHCKVCQALLALGIDRDLVEKFHNSEIASTDFPKRYQQDIMTVMENVYGKQAKSEPKEKVVFT